MSARYEFNFDTGFFLVLAAMNLMAVVAWSVAGEWTEALEASGFVVACCWLAAKTREIHRLESKVRRLRLQTFTSYGRLR
jgi:hypothetical protein